jgi:hypothetical protein
VTSQTSAFFIAVAAESVFEDPVETPLNFFTKEKRRTGD